MTDDAKAAPRRKPGRPAKSDADAPAPGVETMQLPLGWQPRPYQVGLWEYLLRGGTRADVVAHRRWGKDEVALHWAAARAATKPGSYWHLLPEAEQGRKAIWNAVNPHTGLRRIDEAFPTEVRTRRNEGDMRLELANGSTWQVIGSDNYNALMGVLAAGRGLLGVVAGQARGLDLHPADPGGERRVGAVPLDAARPQPCDAGVRKPGAAPRALVHPEVAGDGDRRLHAGAAGAGEGRARGRTGQRGRRAGAVSIRSTWSTSTRRRPAPITPACWARRSGTGGSAACPTTRR